MKKTLVSILSIIIMSTSTLDAQNRKRGHKHYHHNYPHHHHQYRGNTATDILLPLVIGGIVYGLVQDNEAVIEKPCPYVEHVWVPGYWKTGPLRLVWVWKEGYWKKRIVECPPNYRK